MSVVRLMGLECTRVLRTCFAVLASRAADEDDGDLLLLCICEPIQLSQESPDDEEGTRQVGGERVLPLSEGHVLDRSGCAFVNGMVDCREERPNVKEHNASARTSPNTQWVWAAQAP